VVRLSLALRTYEPTEKFVPEVLLQVLEKVTRFVRRLDEDCEMSEEEVLPVPHDVASLHVTACFEAAGCRNIDLRRIYFRRVVRNVGCFRRSRSRNPSPWRSSC
jgi:hypothetical protein